MRPTWDDYFLMIAETVSLRSTCPRRHVGVVVVDDQHHIVSTGYNGAPPGELQCDEVGCQMENGHCKRAIHADMNALKHATRETKGCTMYIYGGTPCLNCAQAILDAGIVRVVCYGTYPDPTAVELFRQKQVPLEVKPEVYRPLPQTVTSFEEAIRAIHDAGRLVMCRKQYDYGPMNILATGQIGVAVRAIDKTQRLWNLLKNGRAPQNESVLDTWMDLMNYGLIGLMVAYDWFTKPSYYRSEIASSKPSPMDRS